MVGDTGFPSRQVVVGDLVRRGLTIVGAHDSDPPDAATDQVPWGRHELSALFLAAVARGAIALSDLVIDVAPADEVEALCAVLDDPSRPTLGALIDWSGERDRRGQFSSR